MHKLEDIKVSDDLSDLGGIQVNNDLSDLGGKEIGNVIPDHENFLQNAIKIAGTGLNAINEFSQGFGDTETFGLNRLAGSLGTNAANSLFPSNPPIQNENPETPARAVGQALPIVHVLGSLFKGGADILSGANIRKARGAMSDAVQNAAKTVEERIGETTSSANTKFGKDLGQIGQTDMTPEHFNQALQNTADAIDPTKSTHAQPGSLANHVLSQIEPISNETNELGLPIDNTMTGPQIQAKIKTLQNSLGHPVAKAEFWNQISNILPDALSSAKESRAAGYAATEAASPLQKIGTLNKVAKGTMGPETLAETSQAAKGIGADIIPGLQKAGKGVKNAQLATTIGRTGAKAVGLGGIEEFIRHLWQQH